MNQDAKDIVAYCAENNWPINPNQGAYNIIYIEGVNLDLTDNNDAPDEWNDLRLLIDHDADGDPYICFRQVATTEPGRAATKNPAALKKGGVARIRFGHHLSKWRMGWHNYSTEGIKHPALVHDRSEAIMVHRDLNQDGKRTNDKITPATGINHHGTKPGASPSRVGAFSAGCLVGQDWVDHMKFMEFLKNDVRYNRSKEFKFSAIIIDGSKFNKWRRERSTT